VLFCFAGLAAAGLEHVSFGHAHLMGGHVFYHHHFHCGLQERLVAEGYPETPETGHGHDHDPHRAPVPGRYRDVPGKTAIVSVSPVLLQPVATRALAAPPADVTSATLSLALPLVVRPVGQSDLSRGPPPLSAPPYCWEKASL